MSSTREPSGRFLLRIDPGLHAALRRAAQEAGMSLNDYCATRLAAPVSDLAGWGPAAEAVRRAAAVAGNELVGVVAFGSWTRAELHDGSDIDLMVVVGPSLRLSRRLYSAWDEAPVSWRGHRLEPHFVHLPEPSRTVSGIWAEVAVDGIVLFARGPELFRRLAAVRRDIASGRIVRRVVHGQPYWVEAA